MMRVRQCRRQDFTLTGDEAKQICSPWEPPLSCQHSAAQPTHSQKLTLHSTNGSQALVERWLPLSQFQL
ncbi:hypothetical protein WJX75_001143 [Coccomyxa subellipsoidea]|uniref:Uncharacterized protein n=1 Tax=Coccomyxa subellipsoidea TaxID=248742 RepID=A0ABR2YCP1_9CHLO